MVLSLLSAFAHRELQSHNIETWRNSSSTFTPTYAVGFLHLQVSFMSEIVYTKHCHVFDV